MSEQPSMITAYVFFDENYQRKINEKQCAVYDKDGMKYIGFVAKSLGRTTLANMLGQPFTFSDGELLGVEWLQPVAGELATVLAEVAALKAFRDAVYSQLKDDLGSLDIGATTKEWATLLGQVDISKLSVNDEQVVKISARKLNRLADLLIVLDSQS